MGADTVPKKLGSHSLKTGTMTVDRKYPQKISTSGKIFAVIVNEVVNNGTPTSVSPYWDGEKICYNSGGWTHVYATIENDRKSVTFRNTQDDAKTLDYAIFYE